MAFHESKIGQNGALQLRWEFVRRMLGNHVFHAALQAPVERSAMIPLDCLFCQGQPVPQVELAAGLNGRGIEFLGELPEPVLNQLSAIPIFGPALSGVCRHAEMRR